LLDALAQMVSDDIDLPKIERWRCDTSVIEAVPSVHPEDPPLLRAAETPIPNALFRSHRSEFHQELSSWPFTPF
jgi:hypothetical protein